MVQMVHGWPSAFQGVNSILSSMLKYCNSRRSRSLKAPKPQTWALRGVAIVVISIPTVSAAEWSAATWRGLPAFRSEQGGWTAAVCPQWGRLVSVTAPDGQELLHVSDKPSLADCQGGTAGGHMVWLGPQARWNWPPPAQWEYSAATSVVSGGALSLQLPEGTPQQPGLTRRYAWTSEGLRCSVSWRAEGRWHALQVFQVRADARVRLTPVVREGLPAGFAVRTGNGGMWDTSIRLPQPCLISEGSDVIVQRADPFQKIFFPLQAPRISFGSWNLALERLAHDGGGENDEPDNGLPTQIFAGQAWEMIEVEQASPMLDGSTTAALAEVVLRILPSP